MIKDNETTNKKPNTTMAMTKKDHQPPPPPPPQPQPPSGRELSSIYNHIENMGQSLKCPICQSTLSETPMIISCCVQAFCKECIYSHIDKVGKHCPVCKNDTISKRSLCASSHLKDMVSAYRNLLQTFELIPMQYDPEVSHFTQLPFHEQNHDDETDEGEGEEEKNKEENNNNNNNPISSIELEERINVSRAWKDEFMREDQQSQETQNNNETTRRRWIGQEQEKVVKSNENVLRQKEKQKDTNNSNDRDTKKDPQDIRSNITTNSDMSAVVPLPDDTNKLDNIDEQPTQKQQQPKFKAKQIVEVQARTWPGINKLGGTARITSSPSLDKTTGQYLYNVAYILGGREKYVEEQYIFRDDDEDKARRAIKQPENFGEEFCCSTDNNVITPNTTPVSGSTSKRRRRNASYNNNNKISPSSAKVATPPTKTKTTKTSKTRSLQKNTTSIAAPSPSCSEYSKSANTHTTQKEENSVQSWTPEEAIQNTETFYKELLEQVVMSSKKKLLYILLSSVPEHVHSLVNTFTKLMKKQGVTIKTLKDLPANTSTTLNNNNNSNKNTKPTICITSSNPKQPTVSNTRTLKAMRCAINGIPLLTSNWLRQSIKQNTLIVSPTVHENMCILSLPVKGENVVLPQKQQQQQQGCVPKFIRDIISSANSGAGGRCRLFENMAIILCGDFVKKIPKSDIIVLSKDCGVNDLLYHSPFSNNKNNNSSKKKIASTLKFEQIQRIVLLCDDHCETCPISDTMLDIIEENEEHFSVLQVVNTTWLFDCISFAQVLDGVNYLPQQVVGNKRVEDLVNRINGR